MKYIEKKIAVIGSGTMGNGIAHVFALQGFQVYLSDISREILDSAMSTIHKNMDRQIEKGVITKEGKTSAINNITTTTHLEKATAGISLVIEAATEKKDTKLQIFSTLDDLCDKHTILASNTSSISITALGAVTKRPDKVIGMHFMNPAPVMKLIEVVKGYNTSSQVTEYIVQLSKQLNKVPIVVRDYPGFVSNRILMPMINEAIYALFEGVSGVKEIDQIMQLGMVHPMGPLRLADFIGLDICLSILEVLYEGFGNPKYAPCPLLIKMVAAGKSGYKTGEGFYDYRANKKEPEVAQQFS